MQFSVRPAAVGSRPNIEATHSSDRPDTVSRGSSWAQQPVEHLLVATDLTQRSDRAIERSVELADLLGAQLSLLHVIDEGLPRRITKHRRREALTLLQEHIRLLSSNAGRDVSINVRTGDVFAEIAREAIALGSDAIILGMHRQQPLGHRRSEPTAANVVHYSDRPVLIVKHRPTGPYRCAVVHVGPFRDASATLKVACRLAPRAEPHIIDANCATVSRMRAREAHTASSSQSLRRETPDFCRALERGPWPEPATVHPGQNKTGVLRAAVGAFHADLLVVELCQSGEERGLPPHHAVSNVLGDPPCDLLLVRGPYNSKLLVKGADGR